TGRRRFFLYGICAYMLFQNHARAGIAAAALSCGLLCVGLRRYRSLITGVAVILILVATAAILQPERLFETASTMSSEMVYKGIQGGSVLASRELPWKDAVNTIRSHFWFGTGFGTTDKGHDAKHRLGSFSSNSEVAAEY